MNMYMEIDEALDDIRKYNSKQHYTTHLYPICYNSWKEMVSEFVEWWLETIFCCA